MTDQDPLLEDLLPAPLLTVHRDVLHLRHPGGHPRHATSRLLLAIPLHLVSIGLLRDITRAEIIGITTGLDITAVIMVIIVIEVSMTEGMMTESVRNTEDIMMTEDAMMTE